MFGAEPLCSACLIGLAIALEKEKTMNELAMRTHIAMVSAVYRLKHGGEEGQGTTEYAILVGVLAVIAMLAISAFKGKISELWTAISDGVNGL